MAPLVLTLDVIAYDLLTTIKQTHDDSNIDIRQMKYWIKNSRATWIRNELAKFKPLSPRFTQDLGCIDLEVVDASLCGLNTDYKIKRTVQDIPSTIEVYGEPTFTRIGPAMIHSAKYTFIPFERVPYIGHGKFNQNAIFAFLWNERVYLLTHGTSLEYAGLGKLNIKPILANPEEASKFTKADGTPCYTDASEYPITENLVTYMKDILIQSDIRYMFGSQSDTQNNARDDAGKQPVADPNQGQG